MFQSLQDMTQMSAQTQLVSSGMVSMGQPAHLMDAVNQIVYSTPKSTPTATNSTVITNSAGNGNNSGANNGGGNSGGNGGGSTNNNNKAQNGQQKTASAILFGSQQQNQATSVNTSQIQTLAMQGQTIAAAAAAANIIPQMQLIPLGKYIKHFNVIFFNSENKCSKD